MIKLGNNRIFDSLVLAAIAVAPLVAFAEKPITSRPLDSFPESDRVWLGSFGAEVEVDPASEIIASRSGDIHWLAENGETVEEGQVFALMSHRQIRQSAAQLEIDEAKLPARRRSAIWSHREKRVGLQRQLEELHARQAKVELTPEERRLIGSALLARIEAERAQLGEQIADLEEQLSPEFLDEELRLELAQMDHDIERARLEHDELVKSMQIIAEHEGILEIESTGYVRANDVIGHVRRSGYAIVTVQMTDPDVRAENPGTLGIAVMGPDGRVHRGVFNKSMRGNGGRMSGVTYVFDLNGDTTGGPPPRELAGERMAIIEKMLPDKARIIPKSPLLFSHPEEINRLGWARFLQDTWPGTQVAYIGPNSVALEKAP